MSRQTGPFFLVGIYGNVCAYKMGKDYYFRQKSSLTGKRVKTSARYKHTMDNARLMGRSSVIASGIYAALPPGWKDYCMFRVFVGEAHSLLKAGKTDEEARQVLWERYLAEFEPGYREEDEFRHVTPEKKEVVSKPRRSVPGYRKIGVGVDGRLRGVADIIFAEVECRGRAPTARRREVMNIDG